MTPREIEEYSALRATIRERGTARVWIFVAGLAAWAAAVIATASLASLPIATLLPLLLLAGVFEAVYALHTGVERVGRYIQVFYEGDEDTYVAATAPAVPTAFGAGPASGPATAPLPEAGQGAGDPAGGGARRHSGDRASRNWEHTAMAFGRAFPGGGSDPLFAAYFWLAAVLNLIPAALAGPVPIEWSALGIAHVVFVGHVVLARRRAAHQRAVDLDRFQKLKAASPGAS